MAGVVTVVTGPVTAPLHTVFTPRTLGFVGPVEGFNVYVTLGYYPEGSPIARWDVALWDTAAAVWQGAPPDVDVSCQVIDVRITRGRDQPLDRFRTGTCTVTINDPLGEFSPWRTAPDPAQYATVRPGITLAVWVLDADGTSHRPRFAGRVDSIVDSWPMASPDLDAPHRVTFMASDFLADLAVFDGVESPPAGAGELSGARIGRVLANARYTGPTSVDPGTVTLQATTLAKNALDECGMVNDTERGAFFCDAAGVITFRDRNGLVGDEHYTTVQAVFGEHPEDFGDLTEMCYDEIRLASDGTKIRNLVTIAREGGTAVTVSDDTSRALYGTATFRRLDLIHTNDAESAVIANDQLQQFAYAANRVESLRTSAVVHPDNLAKLLVLDVLWLIEVRRRTRGFQVIAQLQIQGIEETISADAWTFTFRTFAASDVFGVARWDRGAWDSALWGY